MVVEPKSVGLKGPALTIHTKLPRNCGLDLGAVLLEDPGEVTSCLENTSFIHFSAVNNNKTDLNAQCGPNILDSGITRPCAPLPPGPPPHTWQLLRIGMQQCSEAELKVLVLGLRGPS